MTNPLAGGPEDAPRKPDDPQPSPHGRDLTQLPRVGRQRIRSVTWRMCQVRASSEVESRFLLGSFIHA